MRRVAFVAGANGPAEFGLLEYASQDAMRVAAALGGPRAQFYVEVPPSGADKYAWLKALDLACSSCAADDTFILYFAGHGVLDAGELFLVVDDTESLHTSAVPVEIVTSSIRRCRARNRLLILDCCHAGGAIRTRGHEDVSIQDFHLDSENDLVLMASGRLEKVREFKNFQGSFLSWGIVEALGDAFYRADTNGDLALTLEELVEFLEESARIYNQAAGTRLLRTSGVVTSEDLSLIGSTSSWQLHHPENADTERTTVSIPQLFGSRRGDFLLTPPAPTWIPHEIPWPDGTTMVVLPIPPVAPVGPRDRVDWNFGERVRRSFPRTRSEAEIPKRPTYALAMAKHPVTNSQYKDFLSAGGARSKREIRLHLDRHDYEPIRLCPEEPNGARFDRATNEWVSGFRPWEDEIFSQPDLPVVCISFAEAVAYSTWANEVAAASLPGTFTNVAPYRLWDFAAFGSPYRSDDPKGWRRHLHQAHHRADYPAPVHRSGLHTNALGLADLFGNVWEWCGSMKYFLDRSGFQAGDIYSPEEICLRGGSFQEDLSVIRPFLSSPEIPFGADTKHADHGFRLAALVPFDQLPEEVRRQINLRPVIDIQDQIERPAIREGSDF